MPTEFADLYAEAEISFADLFSSNKSGGTGSESADSFLGSMLGLTEAGDDAMADSLTSDIISSNTDIIRAIPREEIAAYVDQRTKPVFEEMIQEQMGRLHELYRVSEDPSLINEARQVEQDLNTFTEQPVGNKVVLAALARMGKEGLSDSDRHFVRRQAQLAMLQEYLDYSDLGVGSWLGSVFPGRNSVQMIREYGMDFLKDFENRIATFKSMLPEEQVKQFPAILADLWEISGENPYIFRDRAMSFIDRKDVDKVYQAIAFDALDVGTIIPFTKIARLISANNTPIKFARNAGNKETAAKLNAEVLEDPSGKAEAATGVDRVTAAANGRPFGGEGLMPEITDGLAAETQQVIAERLAQSREFLNRLIYDGNTLINRSPLTEREIQQKQKLFLEKYAGKATITESTPSHFVAEVTIENPKFRPGNTFEIGTAIRLKNSQIEDYQRRLEDLRKAWKEAAFELDEYKTIQDQLITARAEVKTLEKKAEQALEPPTKVETIKVEYKWDDVGLLEATEFRKASSKLSSADVIINQMEKGLVEESTVIGFSQQQMRGIFEKALGHTLRGLSNKQRKGISAVLLQGDYDKISRYSSWDLFNGITTKDGLIRLKTAEEVAAYHGARDLLDTFYIFKNRQLRKELAFEDYKSVKLRHEDGEEVLAFVRPEKGLDSIPSDVKRLYDFATGKIITVGSRDVINRRIQEEGWGLLKMKYPAEFGDEFVEYVLARKSDIKRLPDRVLAYRPGYVPRIYKNVFYVAEEIGPKLVNGVSVPAYKTVRRFFDNETDANKWKEMQRKEGVNIQIQPGREWLELDPKFKQDYEAAIFGGLFSGKRSDEVIPFGLNGTPAEHIGAFQAIEAAVGHISTRVPINEFRMGMIRRFLNSARHPDTGAPILENPSDFRSPIVGLAETSDTYAGLTAMRQWLEDQLRIPTQQERAWNKFSMKLAQALDGEWTNGIKPINALRIATLNMGHKDVYAQMRSLAFHALLGWLNPAQLYVQALGASMAFSLNPAKAAILVPRYMALRAAYLSDNQTIWRRTAAAAGLDGDTFVELMKAYRRTGIKDAVRSTADYDAAIRGYGISASSMSRIADKGLVFFREGETFVRSYGWLLAHDEFLKGKPKGYKLRDQDIDAITKRSLTYTLNLNRANRAYWQKGVWSIPTQFLQITAKFIESMAFSLRSGRGHWTPAEKARIMAGQFILFGAAGIPFSKWAISNMSEWLRDDGDYGLGIKNPDLITAITGGFTEFAFSKLTGENAEISSRVAIPEGIEQFGEKMIDMVLGNGSDIADVTAGAFGELPGRAYEAISDLMILFGGYRESANFETAPFLAESIDELLQITSGWRNYRKAVMWERAKAILDSKGNPIMPLDPEEDFWLIVSQKAGLTPSVIEDYYDMRTFNAINRKDIRDTADAWIKLSRNYVNSPLAATEKGRNRIKAMISTILDGLTEDQLKDVAEIVRERMRKDDYKLVKELMEALDYAYKTKGKTNRGLFEGNLELNRLMVPENKDAN